MMRKLKVLIVDDEKLLINNYIALLGSERYEFSAATDGLEAMDKLRGICRSREDLAS